MRKIAVSTAFAEKPPVEEITNSLKEAGVLKVKMTRSWPQKRKGYREVLIEGWVPFADPKAKSADLVKQANAWLDTNLKPWRERDAVDTPPGRGWSYVKGDDYFKLETTFKAAFPPER